MLKGASEQIRAHTAAPAPASTGPDRILDPAIYAASRAPSDTSSPRERPAYTPPNTSTSRAVITPDIIRELDERYRSVLPQYAQPLVGDAMVTPPTTPESLPPSSEADDVTLPEPGTHEAVVFEKQLKRAQSIVNQAETEGYQPQLLISSFSPQVVEFLRACGYGSYFVTNPQPLGASIAQLVAQATEPATPQGRRLTFPRDTSSHEHKMSPRAKKRIIKALASAAAAFGLFSLSYVGARDVICKDESFGGKGICTGLALGGALVDRTPVVSTLSAILKLPIEISDRLTGFDASATEAKR
jgi:hypothetical protein